MRKIRKSSIRAFVTVLMFVMLFGTAAFAKEDGKTLEVMFTHDLHSHLDPYTTVIDGESVEAGGLARINTLIKEQRSSNPDTLLVDGGDFSMGTLYQTLYETDAAELRMLGYMGYDAVTIGNHEFDYRSEGLSNMLHAALESGDRLPSFVISNIDWEQSVSDGAKLVKQAFEDYGLKDYTVVEKGDVKVAVMGIFGMDALACSPTCELTFLDPVAGAKQTVKEIQENEEVDMIVCLSHSGTDEEPKKSEDLKLAEAVPEIDLIISGHTHSLLEEPEIAGDTSIVSCGEYGKNLGSLSMEQGEDGRWAVTDYELIPITDETALDSDTSEKIQEFGANVDRDYLAQFGYTKEQVLAQNVYEFADVNTVYEEHTEQTLGSVMADGFAYGVETLDDGDKHPVDVAVIPSGVIRETYAVGNITVDSVFNSFSLGIGPDRVVGYPLISAYLTGEELRTAAEFDASISDIMPSARLYLSGMNFTYNPNRIILNRLTDCYLTDDDGERTEIEDDKLYRVVFDYYSGQLIGSISDKSAGLLQIQPKDAEGNVIEDFDTAIVYHEGKEVKAWQAIAAYMQSFEKNAEGLPQIPQKYSAAEGRKVVDESTDFTSRFSHPNKYVAMFAGILAVIVLVVILVTVVICKVVKKVRKQHKIRT
ncbi:MAG: bifunctional UDP-sugar hydrolase/5'-nucleotidase [Hespellia sp.]|nr:bifunctional UDP-sugar hydrolase/5'-nucleotidase [Hespellia sp.]